MSEEQHRAGFVAIVGAPNVGKSTLMNRVVGERLAITTPKPQTTRDRIRGVVTADGWQAVFVDTPGIHEPSSQLHRYMVELAIGTLADADLVYVLVDAERFLNKPAVVKRRTARIVSSLETAGTPAMALLNKVDLIRDKRSLLPLLEGLGEIYPAFEELVPLSARTGDGVEGLLELTRSRLPEGPPLFPEDTLTDRSMRFIAAELVREQLFMQLDQELPYQVAVSVAGWKERPDGLVEIHATIHVSRKNHKGIVIGHGGARIKQVGERARMNLERFLERRVYLDLHVRVEPNWPERVGALRKLGYDES